MKDGPFFPVVLKDAAFRPPDVAAYYLIAGDGIYLVRRTPLFSASVRVNGGVPGLREHAAGLTLRLPRLPPALVERAVGFFRIVYERWRGEAILVIFYDPARRRFELSAPPQLIAGRFERGRFRAELRLEYGACEKPGPEYLRLGTIHSHGHAAPVHSSVDASDEVYEPGLHVTVGYVDSRVPAFAAAFVVGGSRFAVPVERALPHFGAPRRPPRAWLDRVTVACERFGGGLDVFAGGDARAAGGGRGEGSHDAGDRRSAGATEHERDDGGHRLSD